MIRVKRKRRYITQQQKNIHTIYPTPVFDHEDKRKKKNDTTKIYTNADSRKTENCSITLEQKLHRYRI